MTFLDHYIWTVSAEMLDRLDKVIVNYCRVHDIPIERNQLHKFFNSLVTVNDQIKKKQYQVKIDDQICLNYDYYRQEHLPINVQAQPIQFEIIYEDDTILVINKPKGLVVHPTPVHRSQTLLNGLLYHTTHLSKMEDPLRLGIVHRLDKDTSGLMVIAKTNKAHNHLVRQLQERTMSRQYLAITRGHFSHEINKIDAPLGRNKVNRLMRSVLNAANTKTAVTNVFVKQRLNGFDLIRCELETGRTHQIRAHMKFVNHSILSDPIYGVLDDKKDPFCQYLHAFLLELKHPITQETLTFTVNPNHLFLKKINQLSQ